jgi:hypothetical protein
MRQRLLMFVDPNPIAQINVAVAERAAFEMFSLAQRRPADLPAHDGPARSRLVDARDFHLISLSKKYGPGIASEAKPDRRGVHPPAAISFSYRHQDSTLQSRSPFRTQVAARETGRHRTRSGARWDRGAVQGRRTGNRS